MFEVEILIICWLQLRLMLACNLSCFLRKGCFVRLACFVIFIEVVSTTNSKNSTIAALAALFLQLMCS